MRMSYRNDVNKHMSCLPAMTYRPTAQFLSGTTRFAFSGFCFGRPMTAERQPLLALRSRGKHTARKSPLASRASKEATLKAPGRNLRFQLNLLCLVLNMPPSEKPVLLAWNFWTSDMSLSTSPFLVLWLHHNHSNQSGWSLLNFTESARQ